ncbi:MAG: peptide-methionine (R)-S-oxide reductase [Alphaproteobacteria bacterium CG_4_10_14_0_8_um_filter_53_9]|nr:MAG: peptide-methionine (R)-S-oxide reductase [Alphaproteobacteria bacterium CG_4_10_14_0_8_um_filter_53_9]
MTHQKRRQTLKNIALATGALAVSRFSPALAGLPSPHQEQTSMPPLREDNNPTPPVTLSEAEWKARLTPGQFDVLRNHGTEPAFTGPNWNTKAEGTYHCAGCGLSVFSSQTKYESGTGWPSFYDPIDKSHIGTSTDWKLFYPRTEVHCARCRGHLGHVFKDGPKPTGLRYCLNGTALTFIPAGS